MDKKYKIMIDAGHGGKDSGACAIDSNKVFLLEKNYNLIFAKTLFNICKEDPRLVPFLTRKDDTFVSLADRVNFSNIEKADLFISLHCNSAEGTDEASDCQIYYKSGKKLADCIFKYISPVDKKKTKWSKTLSANFYVIRKTKCIAVLIEIAFMDNKKDQELLNDCDFQDNFCFAVYSAIIEYLKI